MRSHARHLLATSLWALAVFLPLGWVPASSAIPGSSYQYRVLDSLDIQSLLGDPPGNESTLTHQELEEMLQLQSSRTPRQVARVQSEAELSPAMFMSVMGSSFTEQKRPKAFALLKKVGADTQAVFDKAKNTWNRPRPWVLDARIQPCVKKPASSAYPSGHATYAYILATLLGELMPEKKDLLFARAREIAQDRVLAGVHYPSDIVAGTKLGRAAASKILQSEAYQSDLTGVRAEFKCNTLEN